VKFITAFIAGYASHYGLYDLCSILPFSELSSYAVGVALMYPFAKWRNDDGETFESSYWLTALSYGLGVLVGRVVRFGIDNKNKHSALNNGGNK
jgi:hypothetical protein